MAIETNYQSIISKEAMRGLEDMKNSILNLEKNDYYRPIVGTGETSDPPTQPEITAILGTPDSFNSNMVGLIKDTTNDREWIVFSDKTTWYYEALGSEVSGDLAAHLADLANPHQVTKTQVGLSNVPNLDTTDAVANEHIHANKAQLDLITDGDHDVRTDNPHGVTAVQAGADPLGSAAAVASDLADHEGDLTNPHSVTKAQVGLADVPNLDTTDAVANEHTHANKAQLDLVTDGDHDVRTDNPHGVTSLQVGAATRDSAPVSIDANMICHFDGAEPFTNDFTGNAMGHRGQSPTITGPEVYRPGRFGKALQVAEATTNLITNPVFPNTTGWATLGTNVVSASSEQFLFGDKSLKAVYKDSPYLAYFNMPTIAATAHTATAHVFVPSSYSGTNLQLYFATYAGRTQTAGVVDLSIRDEWQYVICYMTPDPGDLTGQLFVAEFGTLPDVDDYIYIDGVQVEAKSYPTPLCYGDMPDHTWSGTPHTSTSSRANSDIKYDKSNINQARGTIAGWFYADSTGNYNGLWTIYTSLLDRLMLLVYTNLRVWKNGAHIIYGDPFPDGQWNHIAFTWSQTAARLYLNGEQSGATYVGDAFSGLTIADIIVGNEVVDSRTYWNGLVDEFIITDTEMSADLIKAIYESNAPLSTDSAWVVANDLIDHEADTSNPHSVTIDQLITGAGDEHDIAVLDAVGQIDFTGDIRPNSITLDNSKYLIFKNAMGDSDMYLIVDASDNLQIANLEESGEIALTVTMSSSNQRNLRLKEYLATNNLQVAFLYDTVFTTDNGDIAFLPADNVGIGTDTPSAKLEVVGDTDVVQLSVSANSTQTNNTVEIQDSDGDEVFTISEGGILSLGQYSTISHEINGKLQSSTTSDINAARISWSWDNSTHASRKASLKLSASDYGGEREGIAIGANGTEATLGFYGVKPTTQPSVPPTGPGRSVDDVVEDLIKALQKLGLLKQS